MHGMGGVTDICWGVGRPLTPHVNTDRPIIGFQEHRGQWNEQTTADDSNEFSMWGFNYTILT